jgi:alanine racemase
VPSPTLSSPTVATVDLNALIHNLGQVRRLAPTAEIIAIVKADAYGHGAIPVARTLEAHGVTKFGVATLEEGITLREAGIRSTILVLGGLWPEHFADAVAYHLTPVLYDQSQAKAFAAYVAGRSAPYPVHLNIDTGMGRLGLTREEVGVLLSSSAFRSAIHVSGLMTHLADSDNPDPAYTTWQLTQFRAVLASLQTLAFSSSLIHTANSAAILCHPAAHFTAVRPGIMLYGYHTAAHVHPPPTLRPVLSVTTRVVQIRLLKPGETAGYNRTFLARRPTRIAVLQLGYAHGYTRLLSNCGTVLVNGRRAPIVGRVCMEMTLVDVTDVPGVSPGTEVTIIGRQGAEQVTASDLAAWQGTIAYEVLCSLGSHLPKIYRNSSEHNPA